MSAPRRCCNACGTLRRPGSSRVPTGWFALYEQKCRGQTVLIDPADPIAYDVAERFNGSGDSSFRTFLLCSAGCRDAFKTARRLVDLA